MMSQRRTKRFEYPLKEKLMARWYTFGIAFRADIGYGQRLFRTLNVK